MKDPDRDAWRMVISWGQAACIFAMIGGAMLAVAGLARLISILFEEAPK